MGGDLNIAPIIIAHDSLQPHTVICLVPRQRETAHDGHNGNKAILVPQAALEIPLRHAPLLYLSQCITESKAGIGTISHCPTLKTVPYDPNDGQDNSIS
jgi:hypothetical protein